MPLGDKGVRSTSPWAFLSSGYPRFSPTPGTVRFPIERNVGDLLFVKHGKR